MKQVVIRIRDCRPTYFKTIGKFYCHSVSSYEYEGMEFIRDNLLPGMEVYIKVGNLYCAYVSYEEVEDYMKEENVSFEEALDSLLTNYSIMYYIKEYLPTY